MKERLKLKLSFIFQDAVKMNQLQNLLHDALISTEHVQQCAIVRRKDCNIRASSVGFNVSTSLVQSLYNTPHYNMMS